IGYQTQDVPINGRTEVNIQLTPEAIMGEEMVVVGYGTQRKENITGSVEQVSPESISDRPITNVSQGLQGVAANVNINLSSGSPFQSPAINIRGATSIGQGGQALFLVDGVESDPSLLNPKDIKSISVLKGPAAAAEYGARAAFGVIQIITKSGVKKGFSINLDARLGLKTPAIEPAFVSDGYTYVKNFYKAWLNSNGNVPKNINKTQPFSLDYLNEFEEHHNDPSLPDVVVDDDGNYVYYASTDWYKKLYKDNLMNQVYNFSASSGGDFGSFIVSGRYQGQDGLFRYN